MSNNNFNIMGPEFYDVGHGIASSVISGTGVVIITTTGADYHGVAFVAGTTACTIKVYDSVSAATGNLLDIISVGITGSHKDVPYIPVKARKGIVVNVTGGTDGEGTLFYGPKG